MTAISRGVIKGKWEIPVDWVYITMERENA